MHEAIIRSMPDEHLDMVIKGTKIQLQKLLDEKDRREQNGGAV